MNMEYGSYEKKMAPGLRRASFAGMTEGGLAGVTVGVAAPW